MAARWVVLGLAPSRSPWFGQLARWANAGTVPVELLRCQSVDELRVRLAEPRPLSAVLVDGGVPGLDRDVLAGAGGRCPVIVVGGRPRAWVELGAAGTLPAGFDPSALLEALAAVALQVEDVDEVPGMAAAAALPDAVPGPLVAVLGPGGTGASSVAAALAQGIGGGHGRTELPAPAVLVDGCRHADQAMLHDVRDALVGLEELVDAHRTAAPSAAVVRQHCVPVTSRGYDLLLGLRRPRAWAALRPRATSAALAGLRAAYGTVVVDLDHELDGEPETGSIDVEERHHLTRTSVRAADVVLAVGRPGLQGLHALARLVHELVAIGVDPGRVLPVLSRAPRRAGQRAELTKALATLAETPLGLPAPPLHLPERKVEEAFRDGARLPDPLPRAVAAAAAAVAARALGAPTAALLDPEAPVLVKPGSLGALLGDDAEEEAW